MASGRIALNTILWLYMPLMLGLPCYSYYMAVIVEKQQDPFPWSTVTMTACDYPQNILFRFGMLTASSFLALIYFAMFKWLQYQQRRINYPGKVPKYLPYLAQFSVLMFCITIGTIDSKDTGPLHTPCAVIFFIIMFGLTVDLTLLLGSMRRWDSTFMTPWGWFWKKLTAGYLTAVWIYCLIGVLTEPHSNKQDKYIVILEWNEVFVNLLWVLAFTSDFKKVYLTTNIQKGSFQVMPM